MHTAASVTLALALVPVPGYPFALRIEITYTLSDGGLRVRTVATNEGAATAPYGVGFHPWLSPGGADLDDCTLRLDAATRDIAAGAADILLQFHEREVILDVPEQVGQEHEKRHNAAEPGPGCE